MSYAATVALRNHRGLGQSCLLLNRCIWARSSLAFDKNAHSNSEDSNLGNSFALELRNFGPVRPSQSIFMCIRTSARGATNQSFHSNLGNMCKVRRLQDPGRFSCLKTSLPLAQTLLSNSLSEPLVRSDYAGTWPAVAGTWPAAFVVSLQLADEALARTRTFLRRRRRGVSFVGSSALSTPHRAERAP